MVDRMAGMRTTRRASTRRPSSSASNPASRDHSATYGLQGDLGLEPDEVGDGVEDRHRAPLEQRLAGQRGPVELPPPSTGITARCFQPRTVPGCSPWSRWVGDSQEPLRKCQARLPRTCFTGLRTMDFDPPTPPTTRTPVTRMYPASSPWPPPSPWQYATPTPPAPPQPPRRRGRRAVVAVAVVVLALLVAVAGYAVTSHNDSPNASVTDRPGRTPATTPSPSPASVPRRRRPRPPRHRRRGRRPRALPRRARRVRRARARTPCRSASWTSTRGSATRTPPPPAPASS